MAIWPRWTGPDEEDAVKFYPKLIDRIAKEIVQTLTQRGDIEVEPDAMDDARQDFAAIMREYEAQERAISDEAKTMLIRRDWPRSKLAEARRILAAQRKVPLGDDGIDYVINQMLELMMMSGHIEEVYAPDNVLRKRIVTIIRKYAKMDEEVDQEVRARLKHLEEGTADWEIQYKRVQEQVRRIKGLL